MNEFKDIERVFEPFGIYSKMRREQPVYFDPERRNWNIFCYDDVERVLSDYETFSSQFTPGEIDTNDPFSASMIATDPPRHRQLRTLVSQAFTPRAVNDLAPRIQEIVTQHLDRVMAKGEMDAIADLAYPVPVIVIAEMLGVPTADQERFKEWSDVAVSLADFNGNVDYTEFNNPAIMEMSAYFFNMLELRRQQPGNDLISGLLQANIDGETLSTIELLGFCALLLVAGNETTTNLIGNALLTFSEQPELWERLRAQPELLPAAIEEVLRYRSPVQSFFRVAKKDVELGGQTLRQGDPIVVWIGSANRDETQFRGADRFDLERTPNKHLAFGKGIHYCLGAPLARMESRIALESMLKRFKSIERVPGGELERLPGLLVYGVSSLPLKLSS